MSDRKPLRSDMCNRSKRRRSSSPPFGTNSRATIENGISHRGLTTRPRDDMTLLTTCRSFSSNLSIHLPKRAWRFLARFGSAILVFERKSSHGCRSQPVPRSRGAPNHSHRKGSNA